MSFKEKRISSVNNYSSFVQFLKGLFKLKYFFRLLILLFSVFFVFFAVAFVFGKVEKIIRDFSVFLLKTTSNVVGKEIKPDELGQINILVLGCGGENWPGGRLTDTIMIASYNPKLGTVTFLSIPRDLYIEDKKVGYKGKINGLFATIYLKNKDYLGEDAARDLAVKELSRKIKDITDVDVQKHVIITFRGFVDFINTLGGIDIYVPYTLVDTKYPTYDGGRTTIRFERGWHHLNGRDALIYARSRHSTSDFSRAQRQQQIIKAVIKKILSTDTIFDISKLKSLYYKYNHMVYTNITFKEILGMVKYLDKIEHFFSFVYTADCDWSSWRTVEPGCLLYYPPRSAFNGLSVLLPIGSTPDNPGYYKMMRQFAFFVIYNQKFLLENAKIQIENGISRKLIYRKYGYYERVASKLAKKLKVYGFNVIGVKNAFRIYTGTILKQDLLGDYSTTENLLNIFIDYSLKKTRLSGDYNIDIILGNDYLLK